MPEENLGVGREKYILQKREKEKERQKFLRQKKSKKLLFAFLIILVAAAGIAGIWLLAVKTAPADSEIVAKRGIHWHPELSIKILGESAEIPEGIGLGFSENPIHTHDSSGIIHLEFSGFVKKDDIKLSRFFEVWGKKFDRNCIFDKCSGPESHLKMLVDGKENSEFGDFVMADKQKIEIIFE